MLCKIVYAKEMNSVKKQPLLYHYEEWFHSGNNKSNTN
jgi:hypothetical protein